MDRQPHSTLDTRERALMNHPSHLMIGDLLGSRLITSEGKCIGRVADIELSQGPEYRVLSLIYGRRGLLYRLHVLNPFRQLGPERPPDKVAWEAVERIDGPVITLRPLQGSVEE